MNSPEKFVAAFSEYVQRHKKDTLYCYAGYSGRAGCLLIKDRDSGIRIAIRPWLRYRPVGHQDLLRSNERYGTFRGQVPSVHVHVANEFRDNARRFARQSETTVVVALNAKQASVVIAGSGNLSKSVLNALLQFAEQQGFKATYDFVGSLVHKGFREGVAEANEITPRPKNPRVFMSYSWDSDKHQRWVLKLAADLTKNGVRVAIDEWDLPKHNDDLHVFMEAGIRESDAVVLVCTPQYAKRANRRSGGVGVESSIITGEFYDSKKAGKFIPIVRGSSRGVRGCLPSYLKSRFAIDFSQDGKYTTALDQLLRRLFARPRFRRPALGQPPQLESEEP